MKPAIQLAATTELVEKEHQGKDLGLKAGYSILPTRHPLPATRFFRSASA
jgi:hypothetical protein